MADQPDLANRIDRLEKALVGLADVSDSRHRQNAAAHTHDRLTKARADADSAIADAERRVADVVDGGDGATLAKAQRVLAEATARRERVYADTEAVAAAAQQADRRRQQLAAAPTVDDTNLQAWRRRNSWWGVDVERTKLAREIEAEVRREHKVGSSDYFEAIDREMEKRGSGTVQNGTQRIPAEIVEGWRRLGFDVNNPKQVERLLAARKVAADKGLLPPQMPSKIGKVHER